MLREALKNLNPKELNIETFGEIIDKALEENEVNMLVTMEEGTLTPEVKDNIGGGPVIQFYITLRVLGKVVEQTITMLDLDRQAKDEMIDAMLEIVKEAIMEDTEQ